MPNIRACIKESPGKVAYAEFAVPEPGPGQVLVRTTRTTICGSDIHMVDDFELIPPGMPMGHESTGIVEAVGDGRVDLTPLFTHDLSLADVARGYDIFRRHADGVVKIALR